MFEGFEAARIAVARGDVFARVGGSGPPLLLLHGYPQTHHMWHGAAPLLAEHFTVVAADLPGYGDSHRPETGTDHAPHSKRAMAADLVQAMGALGHERFAVAGHDRGARVAYRMALDAPERVTRLAVLDIVPTAHVWATADDAFARTYWHWAFLSQPEPLPEALINANPNAWFGLGGSLGMGAAGPDRYPPGVMHEYRRRLADPESVHAMCEDYRAGATIDRELDEADRGRLIEAPTLVLWGEKGYVHRAYDVLGVWREWAGDVRGRSLDTTHFIPEDAPQEVAAELLGFFGEVGS